MAASRAALADEFDVVPVAGQGDGDGQAGHAGAEDAHGELALHDGNPNDGVWWHGAGETRTALDPDATSGRKVGP